MGKLESEEGVGEGVGVHGGGGRISCLFYIKYKHASN